MYYKYLSLEGMPTMFEEPKVNRAMLYRQSNSSICLILPFFSAGNGRDRGNRHGKGQPRYTSHERGNHLNYSQPGSLQQRICQGRNNRNNRCST